MKFCFNCGRALEEGVKFCASCGTKVNIEENGTVIDSEINENPVQEDETEAKTEPAINDDENTVKEDLNTEKVSFVKKIIANKKMLTVFGAAALALIVLLVIVINAITLGQYKKNLEDAFDSITKGASYAEEYATLESKVWRNSIYENASTETDKYTKNEYGSFYDDFNDALSSFYSGESTKYLLVSLNITTVEEYMSKLKKCPGKYEDEYMALKELYVAYSSLTDLVVGDSSYSYNTFSEALESAKQDYKSALSTAKLLIE